MTLACNWLQLHKRRGLRALACGSAARKQCGKIPRRQPKTSRRAEAPCLQRSTPHPARVFRIFTTTAARLGTNTTARAGLGAATTRATHPPATSATPAEISPQRQPRRPVFVPAGSRLPELPRLPPPPALANRTFDTAPVRRRPPARRHQRLGSKHSPCTTNASSPLRQSCRRASSTTPA